MGLMGLCNGAACGARRRAAERSQCASMPTAARAAHHSATQTEAPTVATPCGVTRMGAARVVRAHSGPPRAVRLSRAAGCLCAASSKHTVTTVKGGHVHEGAGVAGGGLSAHLRCPESRHTRRSHREQQPSAQHAALHLLVGSRLAKRQRTVRLTCGTSHSRAFYAIATPIGFAEGPQCGPSANPSRSRCIGRTRAQSVPQHDPETNR